MMDAIKSAPLRLSNLVATLAFAGCLCVGGAALVLVVAQSPALNTDLRTNGVTGDWRLAHGPGHYNLGIYHYQTGYGFLQADAAPEVTTATESTATLADGLDQAAHHFRESLRYAPGRAAAWTGLAWAELLAGNEGAALRALETSWRLAPHSVGEAPDRLAFADLLLATGMDIEFLRPYAREIAGDLRVLALHRPDVFAAISEGAPALAALADVVRP